MRYVAAYLLAVLGGNKSPSAKDVEGILGSVGIEADEEKLARVISELKGKDVNEVMEAGKEKLATIPTGGGVAAAAGAASGGAAEEAKEEKKEAKKEESEEESDEDMGFGLFD